MRVDERSKVELKESFTGDDDCIKCRIEVDAWDRFDAWMFVTEAEFVMPLGFEA